MDINIYNDIYTYTHTIIQSHIWMRKWVKEGMHASVEGGERPHLILAIDELQRHGDENIIYITQKQQEEERRERKYKKYTM